MPTDPRIISAELQAIAGALTVANNALLKVQQQFPPGPPGDGLVSPLNSIAASATAINTTTAAILAGGVVPPVNPV